MSAISARYSATGLGAQLPAWIDVVDASQLPGLPGFAPHLLRDLDAVTAGLTLHWSSGSIEGALNRIRKIKRQLYGRAGFALLRTILLQRPQCPVPVAGPANPIDAGQ
ncbi:transposase [Streptomyces canus]|uniref:transposase n=1 Tax=Streptomyces canus TaxID=58343 RepID=UPI0033B90389